MARTHALSGAAAWLAAAPPAAAALDAPLEPVEVLAGAVIAAGAGLIPDLDSRHSSVARALGPATVALAILVGRLAGGHRQATHSLAFVALLTGGLWAGLRTPAGPLLTLVAGAVCVGLALRALGPRQIKTGGLVDLGLLGWTAVLTWWGATLVGDAAWLPTAVGLGALLHVLGDALSPGGTPLLWPHPRRWALPLLADGTGGRIEAALGLALLVAVAALAAPQLGAAA